MVEHPYWGPYGVGGIMVSIAAFQAVDPGSIPGRRMCHFCVSLEATSYNDTLDSEIL